MRFNNCSIGLSVRPAGSGLQSNAFKDWRTGKQQVFIPAGIADISRGSRSDSDEHPRLELQNIRTPEGVQERAVSPRTTSPSSTHSGVGSVWDAKPRVVVAIAPRPGANFSDPSGIKKQREMVESLKALD